MSFAQYPEYKDSGVKWLGTVPAHWTLTRFKLVFSERMERSEYGDELLLSVSAYTGVSPRSEVIDAGDHLSRAESLEGYKKCFKDDLVMNIMLAWNRGLAFTSYDGIVSPAYCVFRVVDGSDPKFLNYLVRSDEYTLYFKAFSTGVIDSRLRIYPETFGALFCAIPPRNEQKSIATFLDHETAKIGALVAEQEKLITLLQEKRQAVISHAVTKGLNPNAPMRDSGVEWLGEVPEHWEVVALKRLIEVGSTISYGIVQPGEHQEDGVPFVQTTNMTSGQFNIENLQKTTLEISNQYPRSRLLGGEVILGIRASIGAAYVVPEELAGANLSRGVARIQCNHRLLADYFVKYLMGRAVSSYWQIAKQGSTFNEVSIETVRELIVTVPPHDEQKVISVYVAQEIDKFDALVAEARTAITLQQERRTALISAAVTGQIDVRNWSAQEAV